MRWPTITAVALLCAAPAPGQVRLLDPTQPASEAAAEPAAPAPAPSRRVVLGRPRVVLGKPRPVVRAQAADDDPDAFDDAGDSPRGTRLLAPPDDRDPDEYDAAERRRARRPAPLPEVKADRWEGDFIEPTDRPAYVSARAAKRQKPQPPPDAELDRDFPDDEEPLPLPPPRLARRDRIKPAPVRPAAFDPEDGADSDAARDRLARPEDEDQPSWIEDAVKPVGRPKGGRGVRTSVDDHSRPSSTASLFGEMFGTLQNPDCETAVGRKLFQTDHAPVPGVISPVTNPFLAEDPRSITELRPIYVFQSIPSSDFYTGGGSISQITLQGRVALTDRISFVIHKLGGISISPDRKVFQDNEFSFSEFWFGPKFTFLRDGLGTNTLAAAGLQFQLPTGNDRTFQNTGKLSLVPWVSVTQKLWDTGIGTFNVHDTFGYSISTDDQRSDFFYNTAQLDLNVGNHDRFFPLVGLNWFRYTSDGGARPFLGFEGQDLANVGSPSKAKSLLFIAPGARFKFGPEGNRDRYQVGATAEFPLYSTKDLNSFRLAVDFIFRY